MAEFPEMPNFAAVTAKLQDRPGVLKWLEKLAKWCDDARLIVDKRDQHIDDLERRLTEMEGATQELRELLDDLEDVERGIRTLEEVTRDRCH